MGGAAKVGIIKRTKGMSLPQVSDFPPPASQVHVNMKEHKDMDGAGDVGDKVEFTGHGKISAINKDDMGHRMSIDIHHIAPSKPIDVASDRG